MTDDRPQWAVQRLQTRLREFGIRDLDMYWGNVQPSDLSIVPLDKQQSLISAVRAKQRDGWAFFGQPGTGKSTLANLLFRTACSDRLFREDERSCLYASLWRITARALCQQAQDRATHSGDSGEDECFDIAECVRKARARVDRMTIERAAKQGTRPCLFIEEWDKVGLTDFRRETLFDVLDAMYQFDGQLVLTSNLSYKDFCDTFGDTSWRINAICNIVHLDDPQKPRITDRKQQPRPSQADLDIAAIA